MFGFCGRWRDDDDVEVRGGENVTWFGEDFFSRCKTEIPHSKVFFLSAQCTTYSDAGRQETDKTVKSCSAKQVLQ